MVSQQVKAKTVEPEEEMDTGVDADVVSVAGDNGENGSKKRERSSPDPPDSQVSKKKDVKWSPPQRCFRDTVVSGLIYTASSTITLGVLSRSY